MKFHKHLSMDDSNAEENIHGIFNNNSKDSEFQLRNNLVEFVKCSFLVGADKLLFTQRPFKETTIINKPNFSFLESNCNGMLPFLTLLVLKLAAFQLHILMGFLSFPFKLLNLWITLLTFPLRTLILAKRHLKQKLVNLCKNCFMSLMSLIFEKLKIHKSILRLGVRMCWAIFWAIYVWFTLVGLLILGFAIGGIIMRYLIEVPINTTETLNFDYTKASPVAFLPITSSPVPVAGFSADLISTDKKAFVKQRGGRSLPHHHKLKLSVSLTMPESDYNTNLGIFQVRVESLSADGKVTASFMHPSMLHYRSQPIKYIETFFKSIPILTGFQSEVQNLIIRTIDFTEGVEPTACFKVSIEQRARFEPGFGLPEIYAASMHIETHLPKLKRFIWNWRTSVLVWLSFSVFLIEVAIFAILFSPIILPGRALIKTVGAKGKY